MTTPTLTWDLPTMAMIIGELPGGDTPKAWWSSLDDGVVTAWETFRNDQKAWIDGFTELCELSKLDTPTIKFSHLGEELVGIIPPKGVKPPTWWRVTKDNLWVPRKRTQAEKNSEVSQRFEKLRRIPTASTYLPGLPTTVWAGDGRAYPVSARKPAKAVLVFVGADPDTANPPFTPDNRWTRMKLSTFHILKERQDGKAVTWPRPDPTGVRRAL